MQNKTEKIIYSVIIMIIFLRSFSLIMVDTFFYSNCRDQVNELSFIIFILLIFLKKKGVHVMFSRGTCQIVVRKVGSVRSHQRRSFMWIIEDR